MANEFARNIKDAALPGTTKALPAAGATNYHDSVNVGAGYYTGDGFELEVSWPTLTNLTPGYRVTLAVQDSTDNAFDWKDIISASVFDPGGALPAGSKRFALPSSFRRWLRVSQSVQSGGGDLTAISTTARFLF